MLTEKTKTTIREEESYRQAVRAELEKGFSKKKKLFLLVNTPLGISILTMLISFCGFGGVNAFIESRKSKAQNSEKVNRLKQEVALRSGAFNCLSDTCDQSKVNELRGLIYGHSGAIYKYNVYKEFNERDMRSLILESRSLISDSFSDKQLLIVNDLFDVLKDLERNSFNVTYFRNDGMGSSGSYCITYYKLPIDLAKTHIKLILDNFQELQHLSLTNL